MDNLDIIYYLCTLLDYKQLNYVRCINTHFNTIATNIINLYTEGEILNNLNGTILKNLFTWTIIVFTLPNFTNLIYNKLVSVDNMFVNKKIIKILSINNKDSYISVSKNGKMSYNYRNFFKALECYKKFMILINNL